MENGLPLGMAGGRVGVGLAEEWGWVWNGEEMGVGDRKVEGEEGGVNLSWVGYDSG